MTCNECRYISTAGGMSIFAGRMIPSCQAKLLETCSMMKHDGLCLPARGMTCKALSAPIESIYSYTHTQTYIYFLIQYVYICSTYKKNMPFYNVIVWMRLFNNYFPIVSLVIFLFSIKPFSINA